VASPTTGVNTVTGHGLPAALESADAVIDLVNPPQRGGVDPEAFFATSAERIAAHERLAGVRHHVTLSIVGADTLAEGYFSAKAHQEQIVRDSGVPHTILRATQFYEFARVIANANTIQDTVKLPSTPVRPMSSDDVAIALVRAVMNDPATTPIEICGPQQMTLPEFVGRVLLSDRDPRYVVDDPDARPAGFNVEGTFLVPYLPDIVAPTTLDQWLRRDRHPRFARVA
jgi:uncharacterized protein YbjT (DUF2867 family)